MEVGRLKGQGREKRREREDKGKGKGKEKEKERERKGKVKVITLISQFRFVSKRFRNTETTETNRKRWLYSFGKNTETEPKLPVLRFVSVRTERKKSRFAGHPNCHYSNRRERIEQKRLKIGFMKGI